ncbi:hypothetical protein Bpfe_012892, partial [Biomphalaria pfeifferi]
MPIVSSAGSGGLSSELNPRRSSRFSLLIDSRKADFLSGSRKAEDKTPRLNKYACSAGRCSVIRNTFLLRA